MKFTSRMALRLTASVGITCQLGLDLCPVSTTNDADPALVRTIVGRGSRLLPSTVSLLYQKMLQKSTTKWQLGPLVNSVML